MKPLVLFSSMAVLCASGLLALSYDGWHDDPSALTSLSSETTRIKINPGVAVSTPQADQPSADTKAAVSQKVEEKVAAVDPGQPETKPANEAEPLVKLQEVEAEPKAVEAKAEGASFDIVRVEEDGSAVLAGRAEPGDTVRLLINEKVAGETQANDRGEWVIIPASSMPAGAHQMQIETENAAGEVRRAEQSVALTVPDQPGTQPLIVLSETAKPSIVLQKPAVPQVAQSEDTQQGPSTEAAVSKASSSESSEQPAPEAKTAALEPSASAKAPSSVPGERKLAVDVVDYDEAGRTTFSGRAAPDSRVRVYVDNSFVGEASAESDGTWSFTADREIASGPHALRTDEVAPSGQVTARIELPFFRESPERIASLQSQRKVTSEDGSAKPEAAPLVTDTEPGEAPKVAAADASVGSEPAQDTTKPGETKTTKADETVVVAKPEVSVTVAEEEKSTAPAQPAVVATTQTSGLKTDAEPVKSPPAPETAGSSASQQIAAADTVTRTVETEAPKAAEAVENATKPASSETSQQTAVVEAATEPAKPEMPQQTAEVEPVTEPAKPETNQQLAATAPVVDQEKVVQETLKPATPEPATASDSVEMAAVTAVPEKTGTAALVTGKVVIQPGNNLWQISRVIYGKGRQFTVIYEANRTQIRDPDRIYPGQIFETPGSNAPESIDPACRSPLAECE